MASVPRRLHKRGPIHLYKCRETDDDGTLLFCQRVGRFVVSNSAGAPPGRLFGSALQFSTRHRVECTLLKVVMQSQMHRRLLLAGARKAAQSEWEHASERQDALNSTSLEQRQGAEHAGNSSFCWCTPGTEQISPRANLDATRKCGAPLLRKMQMCPLLWNAALGWR